MIRRFTTGLRVTYKGESKEFRHITPISVKLVRFAREYRPAGFEEEEIVLETYLDKFFSEPGYYQVQFLLFANREKARSNLESKPVTIRIEEPTGINKEAHDLLKKYRSKSQYGGLFDWDGSKKQSLLQAFVKKYDSSIYGEYAISSLGIHYLYSGELEKAKAEFEKIKSSKRKQIADSANRSLKEIEAKLRN